MTSSSAGAGHDESERAFLQARLALFGKVMTVIFTLGLIAHVTMTALEELLRAWFFLYVLSGAIYTVVWIACSFGSHTRRAVRLIEVSCLVVSTLALGAMGRLISLRFGDRLVADTTGWSEVAWAHFLGIHRMFMGHTMLYGTALAVASRAAIVPSSPRYTALLTASLGVPLGLVMAWPSLPVFQAAGLSGAPASIPIQYPIGIAVNTIIWWTITTVVCTAISIIIYGLRREIRQARRLGQYTLESKIGEGGMGIVYRASHAMMRRPTAVKLLPPDRAGEKDLARFEREVQQTARLTHPNTITIFDYGSTPDGIFYYVMELLDGASTQEVVEQTGPMPPERVIHVLSRVAAALDEAHGIGLIHRDIKPANIILCSRGGRPDVPKLLDFGLVKEVGGGQDATLTQDGVVSGTPLYMSPEAVINPSSVNHLGDIYAVGAVAYFMLTGKTVFEGANLVEICSHHLHTAPTPPSERLGKPLPADLESHRARLPGKGSPESAPAPRPFFSTGYGPARTQPGGTSTAPANGGASAAKALLTQREEIPLSDDNRTIAVNLARNR